MNNIILKKEKVVEFVKTYNYTSIDDGVLETFALIIKILVFNILNNVTYITQSLKVSIVKKEHFIAVLQIMKDYQNRKEFLEMKGGFTVLPSEYFGNESGSYYSHDVVSAIENHPWTGLPFDLTRTELNASLVGGSAIKSCFVTIDCIKDLIAMYKESHLVDFKVSKDVFQIIHGSVMYNFDLLLKHCSKSKQKKLTNALIHKVLKANKSFLHLSYILK